MARIGRCLAKVKLEQGKDRSQNQLHADPKSYCICSSHLLGHTRTHNRGFCMHGWNQPQIEKRGDTRCSELNLQMEGRKSCIDTRLCPTLNYPLLCKTGFLRCVFPWETPCSKHPLTLEGGGSLCCRSTGEHHLCGTTGTPQSDKDIPGRRRSFPVTYQDWDHKATCMY